MTSNVLLLVAFAGCAFPDKLGPEAFADTSRPLTDDARSLGDGGSNDIDLTDDDARSPGGVDPGADASAADSPEAGSAAKCEDGDCAHLEEACVKATCNPLLGCQVLALADGTACDDGDACTGSDQCQGEACQPGAAVDCDDGNVCTVDSCAPAGGCIHAPTVAPTCDDGDECTESDRCKGKTCAGMPLKCNDGDPCTVDSCLPQVGCQHVATPGCKGSRDN